MFRLLSTTVRFFKNANKIIAFSPVGNATVLHNQKITGRKFCFQADKDISAWIDALCNETEKIQERNKDINRRKLIAKTEKERESIKMEEDELFEANIKNFENYQEFMEYCIRNKRKEFSSEDLEKLSYDYFRVTKKIFELKSIQFMIKKEKLY